MTPKGQHLFEIFTHNRTNTTIIPKDYEPTAYITN